MFTIVEIDKTGTFLGTFTPYAPYVFKSIITVGGTYEIADYWTNIFGADGTFNETEKNITGVVLNSVFDVEMVDTLGDLLNQVNSFYFDYDNQELYIHFPHFWGQQSVSIATGQGLGYCSDTVRYFRNQIYRPIVKSIPSLGDSIDPLQYGIIAFGGGTVTLVNDGSFDEDEKLYGNNIRIKMGKDGDDYNDLITMFSGYIKDYTTTTQEFIIDVADKRERLQAEYPTETMTILESHNGVSWETEEQLIPEGYGTVFQVRAYPIETDVDRSELFFDGINDYVSIPYNSALYPTSEFRLELSAYMDTWQYTSPTSDAIISCTQVGGWSFGPKSGGLGISLYIDGAYRTPVINFSDISSGWHDFIATFDGRYIKIYMDGVLKDTYDMGGTYSISYNNNVDVLIGADPDIDSDPTANSFWEGSIKNVNLYSDAEGTTPISTWEMQEGTGTTISDSVSSHDGTIHGATWTLIQGTRFKWAEYATSITQVYTYFDDVLTAVSHGSFSNDGTFTLTEEQVARDGADQTKGFKEVYVTGVMRNYSNPADIISDLNDRIMGVEYNSSNYDTTEWEAESADLEDVSLYMNETKKIYDWIEILQDGSDWGFRYEDTDKITLRKDDPDRSSIISIPSIAIRNSDIPIKRNAELYASNCVVKYAKNWRTGKYQKIENNDFETDVINEHRVKKIQSYESLLTSQTDAEEKALRVMTDISVVRPIVTLELDIDLFQGIENKRPRIYDILEAAISLKTQGHRIPELWSYVLGSPLLDVLGDADGVIGEHHPVTFTEAYSYNDNERTYYGTLRGQVIGIQWNTDRDTVTLDIRQRDSTSLHIM